MRTNNTHGSTVRKHTLFNMHADRHRNIGSRNYPRFGSHTHSDSHAHTATSTADTLRSLLQAQLLNPNAQNITHTATHCHTPGLGRWVRLWKACLTVSHTNARPVCVCASTGARRPSFSVRYSRSVSSDSFTLCRCTWAHTHTHRHTQRKHPHTHSVLAHDTHPHAQAIIATPVAEHPHHRHTHTRKGTLTRRRLRESTLIQTQSCNYAQRHDSTS